MFHSIPWNFSISISVETFQSVNIPLSLFSLCMDIFFSFSLFSSSPKRRRIKPPLFVLLGSLVGCNTALHVSTFLFVLSDFANTLSETDSSSFYFLTAQFLLFTMRVSVTSCLWLNVFYYCQIVPAQHPFLVALKKNIRLFVYSALILDKFFFLEEFIVYVASHVVRQNRNIDKCNSTNTKMIMDAVLTDVWLRLAYFLFSLCLMLASGCATFSYLRRHMKNMEKSCRSFSRLQSQMKVTVTGIIQTFLYFLCSVWLIIDDVGFYLSAADFDNKAYIFCTVISIYSFGTNMILGAGQTVFREQVIFIWQTLSGDLLD